MASNMNTKVRLVRCPRCRQLLPELPQVTLYRCGGCNLVLQAKKPKNVTTTDEALDTREEDSLGKQKVEAGSDDKETGCSSSQQFPVLSSEQTDRNNDHNEPRSSTELSSHEDLGSSPEARAHVEKDKESHQHGETDEAQNERMDIASGKSENGMRSEESSREFAADVKEKFSSSELTSHEVEEPMKEVIEDSNTGSTSNFKSLIAEKLLDTRPRKVANTTIQSRMDEEDELSEDEAADLSHHRSVRGFDRVSSVETLEHVPFSNTSYYGYEGSVSSFDGNAEKNRHHAKRPHEFHRSMKKGKHRSAAGQSAYGNASDSRLRLDDSRDGFRFRSPAIPADPTVEKLELLKMVRELQDQLDRTTVNAPQVPSYQIPNIPRLYPGRYGQRMAFSGEAAPPANCTCHRCLPPLPQQRLYSAQLPPPVVCYNTGHYGPQYIPPPYYSPHFSGSSTPQHHSGSEFSSWAHETKSGDERRRTDAVKPKRPAAKKRHVRPIASGAPVISCYSCWELLQLPQSFLLFKRKYHCLKCSACSKVLKFSLVNSTHVVPYYPEESIAAPPCSEAEDYAESSRPRPTSRGEPVSCSDRSYEKSYSTDRKVSSRGSYETIDEKPKLGEPRNRYDDVGLASSSEKSKGKKIDMGLASSSEKSKGKKIVCEIEEIEPAASGSPLHRLMGYASPSKVIRGRTSP